MSGIRDSFSGSIAGEVLEFNPDAIFRPDTLNIRMTRGEHRIADELHKAFGGFRRVVIDVDGERHEFRADSLIRLLEGYEGAPGTRWHQLFGTPERAAETMYTLMLNCARGDGPCERYPAFPRCNWASDDGEETESMMLEWLEGESQ